MSFIGDFFQEIFGGGEEPAVQTGGAREAVVTDERKTRALRSALLETEGGILGEEIEEGGVKKRNTLFGN